VHLTPRESDKLLMFSACEFARRRRAGDLNLNHPEAVALITSEVLELIRDGKSVAEILSIGRRFFRSTRPPFHHEMIGEIQVEGTVPDGTKLVHVRWSWWRSAALVRSSA
jgi:urease gamma subunit